MAMVDRPEAPKWFTEALAAPRSERFLEVEGCRIHYLRWGDPRSPASCSCTAAPRTPSGGASSRRCSRRSTTSSRSTLSGHGDSGRREEYPRELWAARGDGGRARRRHSSGAPMLVGHSMGGFVSIVAASLYGDAARGRHHRRLAGAAARPREPGRRRAAAPSATRRPMPTVETAIARFRLDPAAAVRQRVHPRPHRAHVARSSRRRLHVEVRSARVRQDLARQDERLPRARALPRRAPPRRAQLRRAARDERVHVRAPRPQRAARRDPRGAPPLDPRSAARVHRRLRALLADWEHSVPRRSRG